MHEKFSFFESISRCFMPRLRDQTAKCSTMSDSEANPMRFPPASDGGQVGGGEDFSKKVGKVLPTLNSGAARKEDDSRNSGVE